MNTKEKIKKNYFTIVSVLTLFFIALGTTFAYFTASDTSDEPISATSLDIRMNLNIIPIYNGISLIPTNDSDINTAFNNKCIDKIGNGACVAYTIEITNIGDAQEILGTFSVETDKLVNLKYMVLDADNNNVIYKDVTSATEIAKPLGDKFNLNKGETKKLTLIIWLSNLDIPQNEEQLGQFAGTISVNSAAGVRLTGTIDENLG